MYFLLITEKTFILFYVFFFVFPIKNIFILSLLIYLRTLTKLYCTPKKLTNPRFYIYLNISRGISECVNDCFLKCFFLENILK